MKVKRLFLAAISILSVVVTATQMTPFDKAGVSRNVPSTGNNPNHGL